MNFHNMRSKHNILFGKYEKYTFQAHFFEVCESQSSNHRHFEKKSVYFKNFCLFLDKKLITRRKIQYIEKAFVSYVFSNVLVTGEGAMSQCDGLAKCHAI